MSAVLFLAVTGFDFGIHELRFHSCVQDAAVSERPKWSKSWPAMVVLAVSAIVWSHDVEIAINGKSYVPMYRSLQRLGTDLVAMFVDACLLAVSVMV